MRVVVIGGTGNISTSIVRVLLERGHDVTCFNRGLTAKLPDGVRQIIGDRKDRESFEKVMQEEKFEGVIDMLCYNAEDAESDIRAFRGCKQFVFTSTTCTYGVDTDWMPVTENHPQRAHTPYGIKKTEAEQVFLKAYWSEGFPVVIIRPSTTYGNKLGLLRQISMRFDWIDRIRKGKPILVSGDGKAIHQFLHVDDAAYGFVGALEHEHCVGQAYNLVRDDYIQFDDYHRTMMDILGKEVPMVGISLEALVAIDPKQFRIASNEFSYNDWYSCEKIFRDIPEFRPKISLKEGMISVLESLDANGRIPNSDELPWEDELIAQVLKLKEFKMPE